MTDEFANFRSTVTEHLDVKLQMIDVKLSGSVISRFTTVETNILNRIDFCEISVNRRMDCSDGTIDKLNDKVNKLDNDIQKVDEKVGQLEMKIDINHAIVINRLGVLEGQLGSFIKYQTRFNVTVEQKMQVFNQTTNDHDLAIKRVEKVADRHCEQILELHKMVDWTKAEIRNGCNCDVISQFDQLNNKIDKVSETLTDKFNSEVDNVSKIVQDRLNSQDDKVVKLDDKFSDLVQHAVMSLKTEVVTVKHSVDSKSVDVALCKSRLDVVDKNLTGVITKLKHIPIKNSNVHQSGQNLYPNENQQSMPILVSGNATREQIPSPGQRRVHRNPTRESNLLDLFFTNKPGLVKSSISIPGISDHEIVLTDCSIKPLINKQQPRRIHLWKRADWDKLKTEAVKFKESFLSLAGSRSVTENFNSFKSFIDQLTSKHVPTRLLRANTKHLPWITQAIRRMCKRKQRLFSKAKRSHKSKDWAEYKNAKKRNPAHNS